MKIPITRPFFDERERELLLKPLETGWVVQGPFVAEFEKKFAEFVSAPYAVAVSNCTTALHLALLANGIGPGDEVVIPSLTYVATANAVEYTGARPVFCDIDLRTFNMDVSLLESILKRDSSRKIKGIIPVNLFGLCAALPEIVRLAREHGAIVVEDSACGFGAMIQGKHSGTFGEVGCFSFHPRKAITTGEGGMLVTSSLELATLFRSLRDHGASKSDLARHAEKGASLLPEFNKVGYNYRMTDFQGALGVAQMDKAEAILAERRRLARKYDASLKDLSGLLIPLIPEKYVSGYQSYVCLFRGGKNLHSLSITEIEELNRQRNLGMAALEEIGIATRQGTHAVHTLGYYARKYSLKADDFPCSLAADRLSISLPLFSGMTDEEFDYVVCHLRKIF